MTDERMGDRLWEGVARVPSGGGVVLRHYSVGEKPRAELALRLAQAGRERGTVLGVAADAALARRVGAAFVHNPDGSTEGLPFSRSVHDIDEAEAARQAGAALVFVSPVHATRSHPGGAVLGVALAAEIARTAGIPAIALGGMDARIFGPLEREGFHGWAGIDAWLAP